MTSFQRSCILFIFFIVLAFILFFPKLSLAQVPKIYTTDCLEPVTLGFCPLVPVMCSICCTPTVPPVCTPCCPCCTQCSCSGSWKEYKADAGCKPKILVRECRSVCTPGVVCCTCGGCKAECDSWKECEECGSWQKAERTCDVTRAGLSKPECKCNKDCIAKPENPRYYDNPTYSDINCSQEPDKCKRSENIFLPVKLDWDDVPGWKDGWKENGEEKTCSETCPNCPHPKECYQKSQCVKSYVIRIEGDMRDCGALRKIDELEEKIEEESDYRKIEGYEEEIKKIRKDKLGMGEYATTTDKSEFILPCSCMFKSNKTYTWHVKACCGADGTNCGKESEWKFTTNPAPEPKLPYDPDWNGPERVRNLTQEGIEKLKWCEIDDSAEWQGADGETYKYSETTLGGETYYSPISYKALIYYKKEGGEQDLCHPVLETDGECRELILYPETAVELFHLPQFWDKIQTFFTKTTPYAWKVTACQDYSANYCTDYSQIWRFSADFPLEKPEVISPPDDRETPVGLPVLISWSRSYAMSWRYEITDVDRNEIVAQGKTSTHDVSFDFPQLSLDTLYSWRVRPCWDFEAEECENFWSDTFYFKTTGRPPNLIRPAPNATDIPIPVNFEWEKVPGAKSYRLNYKSSETGSDKEAVVEEPKISIDVSDLWDIGIIGLTQEENYSWQVQTCARENGQVCGEWSERKTFTTFKLSKPASPLTPKNEEKIFTYQMPMNFSWEPVPYAERYQYTIKYVSISPEETAAECLTEEGLVPGEVVEKIVGPNSDFVSLVCLGDYEWQVTACLDAGCLETGDLGDFWYFTLAQPGEPGGEGLVGRLTGGLVPCGRDYDVPPDITPWNERERCQIKHIFILLRNIIDFFLWKLGPLILVLLTVYTGLIYYLAMGAPETIVQVKSLWRTAGIGYGILFLAWTIVSLILTIFGYRVGIFGPWWQIKF